MNTITDVLAYHSDGWHPWPFFWIIPVAFWLTIIAIAVLGRRRWRGRHGEHTLRDVFARGEITESEYRARLKVLRDTRR